MHDQDRYRAIALPPALAERLRTAFDLERTPATLGDLSALFRDSQPATPQVEDLCCTDSRHEVRIGDHWTRSTCSTARA